MQKIVSVLSSLSLIIMLFISGCTKTKTTIDNGGLTYIYTITIGAFTESNGIYTNTGNELIFDSKASCQSWSRTAQGDAHNTNVHLHYNAADDVFYNSADSIFTYTEYGPELDQSAIDATCAVGQNGKTKTVNTKTYFQDKPNVYLRITKVE